MLRRSLRRYEDGVITSTLTDATDPMSPQWRFCYYPPRYRMTSHRHDVAQFSFIVAGAQHETTRKGEVDSAYSTMQFKPVHFQHANEFGPDGAFLLSINLPEGTGDFSEAFDMRDWRIADARTASGDWTRLAALMAGRAAPSRNRLEETTLDLLASLEDAQAAPTTRPAPDWLKRVRMAVEETTTPFGAIAREAGVHRASLARLFRRSFGVSMTECRRRARIALAIRGIVSAGAEPADAGCAAGFSDQSHLTRILRRETGVTPGALRSLFGD